jgi:Heterokaryon incompatibility protein (HET)
MRLLSTASLELHEFFGEAIPPYAILSHTWGEAEVSFQDLQSGAGTSKTGYNKIRRCCQMAASDGFSYAWVDTCCIDKTSSAELSEAINSMYNWYRLSDTCYVYLADVPAHLDTVALEEAIRKSRWFTRGWTLQELIAPTSVIFFDNQWTDIGTKQSLETLLFDITTVNAEVLRYADNREKMSVAQKMSWASKRVTTRVEDTAYCLMGIFGVQMPMLYGEGDYAFVRLQEEIMRTTADHSIFAWMEFTGIMCPPAPGLLARTPASFANSGNIVQCDSVDGSTFSSTNKGIHLLVRTQNILIGERCLAVLDCHRIGNNTQNLGLFLQRRCGQRDMFERILPHAIKNVDRAILPRLKQESIFVKQRRVETPTPLYWGYRILIKDLQKSGLVIQDPIPFDWTFEGDFLLPKDDTYYWQESAKYAAVRFHELDTRQDFILILKWIVTQNLYSDWEVQGTSLSANIIGEAPNLIDCGIAGPLASWDEMSEMLLSKLKHEPEYEQMLMGHSTDRFNWQHPVGKFWISVAIKRDLQLDLNPVGRILTVHINRHTPEAN